MFTFWKNLSVAVAVSVVLSGSAAFAAGKSGSSIGASAKTGGGGIASVARTSTPTFQAKNGNTGITGGLNTVKSLPINNTVSNNNVLNLNTNTGIVNKIDTNKISTMPKKIDTGIVNKIDTNKISGMPKKLDPGFGDKLHEKCVPSKDKCDPCHDKHHHCDPCVWNWSFGCTYWDYHTCPVRLVRIEREVVLCGEELVLLGEGMNAPAVAVQLEVNGLIVNGEIIGREPNKLVVRIPSLPLTGPTLANVRLILENGEMTDPLTVQIGPAR